MNFKGNITYFKPIKPLVCKMGHNGSEAGNGYAFAFDARAYLGYAKEIGVILYDTALGEFKIPFSSTYKNGSLLGLCISGCDFKNVKYNFYVDDRIINDPNARLYLKSREFGKFDSNELICSSIDLSFFDWENDTKPMYDYSDLILYGLNVRAFTMHSSSKVKNKGTFEGIIEKIPYLKELGINGIVLMPSYEFDECISYRIQDDNQYEKGLYDPKVNCWGFIDANYYAPKANYSANIDASISFKNLVKECHKNNIEIFMHFYFPAESNHRILDIISFWKYEYHVDGFRISGFDIPYKEIILEPSLSDTKLWFEYLNDEYKEYINPKYYKNISCNNSDFRNTIRRFNKGDDGLLEEYIRLQKNNPKTNAVINYICDYDGFSLYDLYSYEHKHNEANGESNQDGNDINFSWNCGCEGESRKKTILDLRKNQIKNALALIMLSEGTPYIFSGDEFGNSRYGNNNTYCQDNETGYVKWKNNAFSQEIKNTLSELINIRKNNSLLHFSTELTNLDILKCGYPDLSYHGFEAWRPDLSFNSRTIGLLLYGPSAGCKDGKILYIGINMHWENHRIAIPKISKSYEIIKLFDTAPKEGISKENEIPVMARSISIYEIVPKENITDEFEKGNKASKNSKYTQKTGKKSLL